MLKEKLRTAIRRLLAPVGMSSMLGLGALAPVGVGLALTAGLAAPARAALEIHPEAKGAMPAIPDSVGRAGMAAASVNHTVKNAKGEDEVRQVVLAAGGANFPDAMPWDGGKKVFHPEIYRLEDGKWSQIGQLPVGLGYAAFAPTTHGMIVAGGVTGVEVDGKVKETPVKSVYLIQPDGKVIPLADLPEAVGFPAFSTENNRLIVVGGQNDDTATSASRRTYMLDIPALDLKNPTALKWARKADLPEEAKGRILATGASSDGRVFIFGGAALAPDAEGKGRREYLKDTWIYRVSKDQWSRGADMPESRAAAPSPAPMRETAILILGGDNGEHYASGKGPQDHPGQSNSILVYNPYNNTWDKSEVNWPTGLATAPVVLTQGRVFVVSGETAAGKRTAEVSSAKINYATHLNGVDYTMFIIGGLGFLLLIYQIRKQGLKNLAIVGDPNSKVGRYAWVVVGLLWVVAMLNYLDRQLLTSMRDPIVRDVPQTDVQFGMLTGLFLVIYSLLSPVGGFLADRFSRRIVILVSLMVWSAVTWLTGHVSDYNTLLCARALMGVSEACYIPAALALITDFHRGRTRSLATGIHMSGIYAGMALSGYAAGVTEQVGWRMTFAVFGLIGVGYALVLMVFLKNPGESKSDVPEGESEKLEVESDSQHRMPLGKVLASLFGNKQFLLLLFVMGFASIANWFLLTWLPVLVRTKFNLSLSEAGSSATLVPSIAKYVAVLAAGIAADWWSGRNLRARSLLCGIVFLVTAPALGLSSQVDVLWMFIALVSFQGLAQGALDSNLMPIMRSHVDGRFAATGYGFLNLIGAGLGAVSAIYGGKLKELNILDSALLYAAIGMAITGVFLLLVKAPKRAGQS